MDLNLVKQYLELGFSHEQVMAMVVAKEQTEKERMELDIKERVERELREKEKEREEKERIEKEEAQAKAAVRKVRKKRLTSDTREAEPLRTLAEVSAVVNYFKKRATSIKKGNGKGLWNMYLMSVIGFNTSLRTVDLRELKYSDFMREDGSIKETTVIIESKTQKKKDISIKGNSMIFKAFSEFIEKFPQGDEVYLFKTRQRTSKDKFGVERDTTFISDRMVNYYLEEAKLALGYPKEFTLSQHSYRKTWGYLARTVFNIPIEKISQQLNHGSILTTYSYCGFTSEEDIIMKNTVILGENSEETK